MSRKKSFPADVMKRLLKDVSPGLMVRHLGGTEEGWAQYKAALGSKPIEFRRAVEMLRKLRGVLDDSWRAQAKCQDWPNTDDFFPEHGSSFRQSIRAACESCPVKQECGDYALSHNEQYGLWGGMGPDERRGLLYGIPIQPELAS